MKQLYQTVFECFLMPTLYDYGNAQKCIWNTSDICWPFDIYKVNIQHKPFLYFHTFNLLNSHSNELFLSQLFSLENIARKLCLKLFCIAQQLAPLRKFKYKTQLFYCYIPFQQSAAVYQPLQ